MSLSEKRLTKRLIGGKTIMRTVYIEEHVKEFIKKLEGSCNRHGFIHIDQIKEDAGKELTE